MSTNKPSTSQLAQPNKALLTTNEAAEYLSMSRSKLLRLLADGEFNGCCLYLGRTRYFNINKLNKYINNHTW